MTSITNPMWSRIRRARRGVPLAVRVAAAAVAVCTAVGAGFASTATGASSECPVGERYQQHCVVPIHFTGGPQRITTPPGVDRLIVIAHGASGGSRIHSDPLLSDIGGGSGGRASTVLDVRPGEELLVIVGGRGDGGYRSPLEEVSVAPGGYGGGGDGCAFLAGVGSGFYIGGGGGGGGSFVYRPGAEPTLVVAAGGGGGEGARGWNRGLNGAAGGGNGPGQETREPGRSPVGGGGRQDAPGIAGGGWFNEEMASVWGRAGSGPVAVDADGVLAAATGADGVCAGGDHEEPGIDLEYFGSGAGGGGLYGGGSGGAQGSWKGRKPAWSQPGGGGGGSGIVTEGIAGLYDHKFYKRPSVVGDGTVVLAYLVPATPTTTTVPATTTTVPATTTAVLATTAPVSTTTTAAGPPGSTITPPGRPGGIADGRDPAVADGELVRTGKASRGWAAVGVACLVAGFALLAVRRNLRLRGT